MLEYFREPLYCISRRFVTRFYALFFMVNSCLERRVSLQKHSNVFFKTLYLFLK